MTPLAHRIVKEMTLPLKKRLFDDHAGLLRKMDDIHCFDVSEVSDLASRLGQQYPIHGVREELMFLPAPKTWIEVVTSAGRRGFLIEDLGAEWRITLAVGSNSGAFFSFKWDTFAFDQQRLWPSQGDDVVRRLAGIHNEITELCASIDYSNEWFRAILAIINTPRIIMRRQHMPHRGLERSLLATRGLVGKFPLHAWTEILLKVQPPRVATGEPHEAHLTGDKALHFCRCHLRIRLGMLELVSAHWRGDPALGIKQTRYRLVA